MPVPLPPLESVFRPALQRSLLGLGVFLLVLVSSCVEELDLTEGALSVLVRVDFVFDPEPELAVTARDLPLHRLRLSVLDSETGEGVATGNIELDPDSVPDRWRLRLEVPSSWETNLEGTLELVRTLEGEGGTEESVEWAVQVEPTTVTAQEEHWEILLPFGRGSLAELAVTGVQVSEPEAPVLEGEGFRLAALAQAASEEGARIFWGSEDPEVAEVDEIGFVTTLLPGETRIIAASGQWWAAAGVEVLQRVDSVVVEPPAATATALLQEVTFTAEPLDPRGDPVTDREPAVEWGVEEGGVAEHLGNGVFLTTGPGTTQVFAVIEGVEGRATLTVALEGSEPATNEWIAEGEAAWDDPANWSLGRVPIPGDTVEITPTGSVTVTLEGLEVAVARLILGGEASTATLTLTDSQLTLTEFLWIGPEATLEVHGSSSIPVAGMLNEGTLLVEGELLLLGSGSEPVLTNASSGSLLAGSVGLLQVSLPAGGTFTTRGTVQGEGVESSVVFFGGTVNWEDGVLEGGDALAVLNATLNLTPDLTGEDRELFLQNVVVNGPGGIEVLQFSHLVLSATVVNTWIQNHEGEVLVIDGDSEATGGFLNGGLGRLEIVGLPGTAETSLTVNESDGFFNEGTIVLQDPVTGEGRSLRLVVPQGTFVNAETGIVETPESPGNAVIEIVGETVSRGSIQVVHDLTITGGAEAWQVNAGDIQIAEGAVLTMGGERFLNVDQSEWRGEISGEGTLDVSAVEFVNTATVSPGFSPGILVVEGDYHQEEGGLLFIEISGTEPGSGYDRLVIQGDAFLGGNLTVTLDGYTPEFGDQFTVMTWDEREGEFAGMLLPGLLGGLEWDVAYLSDGLVLSVTVEPQPSQMATGNQHSCAIDSGGAMRCWGLNNGGQLGDGTVLPRSEAVAVSGGITFNQVAPSISGMCGLAIDGAAYCWGGNLFGVLGTGTDEGASVPTPVAGGHTFSWISAMTHHGCGLLESDGTAYCWGRNDFAQLGDGTTSNRNAPVPVQGGLSFTTISAGVHHTCALDADGWAHCWGRNESGELGDGTTAQRNAPTPVTGGLRFQTVSAGNNYTCALDFGGTVHCWGAIGTSEPTPVSAPSRFRTISSGTNFRCAVDFDGNAHCWGTNTQGQLGDGTTASRGEPAPVSGGILFREVQASGPNTPHVCGMALNGDVHCWGSDASGALGSGRLLWSPEPTVAAGGANFSFVTHGSGHACALDRNGQAHCWGTNSGGQLGDGTTVSRNEPAPVLGGMAFDALEAGVNHTCGLSGGVVYCWGVNTSGQLGDGSTTQRLEPTPVFGELSFDRLTTGWNHSCGLSDFVAYCWGANLSGELGDGTNQQRLVPTAVDTRLEFFDITAGSSYTCGLAEDDGTAFCWGFNGSGRLGDGTGTARSTPTQVDTDRAFEVIVAGFSHTCALTILDRTPHCWGLNSGGQLGDGTTTSRFSPVPIGDGLTFRDLALAGAATCGINDNGAVFCWGNNGIGEVGDGTTMQRTTPTLLDAGFPFQQLGRVTMGSTATSQSFLGVASDGTLYGWGSNTSGQFGTGEPLLSTAPIRALFP